MKSSIITIPVKDMQDIIAPSTVEDDTNEDLLGTNLYKG